MYTQNTRTSRPHSINESSIENRFNDFMRLEPFWTSAGETPWDYSGLVKSLPGKFDLSFYVDGKNEIAGYLIGSQEEDVGKLHKIIVHPHYRGHGIGADLWDAFVTGSRQRNLRKLEFRVLPENESAIRLYRKKGCLFHGTTVGTDGKERYDVHYIFHASKDIPHSRPTLNSSDATSVVNQIMSGRLATGERAKELASYMGNLAKKKYGITTNSGANAIFIALKSLGVNVMDKVMVPSYLCGSVLHAIEATNATPVFADINDRDFNISYESVKRKVTPDIRAIIVPHMFGKVSRDIEKIKSLNIPIIEDCAQSLGASYYGRPAGSFGDISIFSFHPTKIISSTSGGVALTNEEEIYSKMEDLLQTDKRLEWGEAHRMQMDDIAATLALSQLEKLTLFIDLRRNAARRFNEFLKDTRFILPELNEGDVFSRYVIRNPSRSKEMVSNLNKRGIAARKPVDNLLHRHYQMYDSDFTNAVDAFWEAISLPIYPSLSEEESMEIAGAILNSGEEK